MLVRIVLVDTAEVTPSETAHQIAVIISKILIAATVMALWVSLCEVSTRFRHSSNRQLADNFQIDCSPALS